MRIALFGGSFDPPHWGHVLAACWAQVAGQCDQVWVLPVARHPYGKRLSPWAQRLALCQAAFAPLTFAAVRADELENASGYTADLLDRLAVRHPGTDWRLIGGSDTAADVVHWHRGAELATRLPVIRVPRAPYDPDPAALPPISSTQVRTALAAGTPITGLVPPAVASLIAAQGWYGPDAPADRAG